jgi:deoxyribose-phosphate aldolase
MREINELIEHTLLAPDTTLDQVKKLCDEAVEYNFAGVCIPPLFVKDTRRILDSFPTIKVVTVVGFPMGYSTVAAKNEEIRRAADDGAHQVDCVINIAAAKSKNWSVVANDTESMHRACTIHRLTMKLILESGFFKKEEIKKLLEIAAASNIEWLKTGTGFNGHPATPEMVKQIQAFGAWKFKVKAAGGIKTASDAKLLIDAGAQRLGCSTSTQWLK